MDYRICEADGAKMLEQQVASLIAAGWRPIGGLSVVQAQSGKWWYYQAVTREAPGGAGKPQVPSLGDFE